MEGEPESGNPVLKLLLTVGILSLSLTPSRADQVEPVQFENGGTRLAGEIRWPAGSADKRCPGLVIIHGSGTSARDNPWTAAWADALVGRGVAVLYPDKRGSGASGGDWKKADFATLAGDAIAGVKLLKRQSRIDPERIGVIGFSQGGDIVPLAASMSSEIKLVINVSGSVVPLQEEIFDEIRQDAIKAGMTKQQIELLHGLHAQVLALARGRDEWPQYEKLIEEARAAGIKGKFIENLPREKSLWVWHWLALNAGFDPLPYWKALQQPALIIYGGQDENVDTRKNLDLLRKELLNDKRNLSLLFLNPNGHALFRDDAVAFVAQWMKDRGAK